MSSHTSDIPAQLRVAQEALEEANRRREVAREAVVDFALRAVVEGQDVEQVMDACGFRDVNAGGASENPLMAMFGLGFHGSRRQRFAQWIGQELCNRIIAGEEGEQQ